MVVVGMAAVLVVRVVVAIAVYARSYVPTSVGASGCLGERRRRPRSPEGVRR